MKLRPEICPTRLRPVYGIPLTATLAFAGIVGLIFGGVASCHAFRSTQGRLQAQLIDTIADCERVGDCVEEAECLIQAAQVLVDWRTK